MKKENIKAIIYAVAAALFYAVNVPCSKILLKNVQSAYIAGFLYVGAGVGVGIMYLFYCRSEKPEERLGKKDMPYTVGMVLLDVIAPILLMIGVSIGTAANASLLGNFEIVATTLIALFFFQRGCFKTPVDGNWIYYIGQHNFVFWQWKCRVFIGLLVCDRSNSLLGTGKQLYKKHIWKKHISDCDCERNIFRSGFSDSGPVLRRRKTTVWIYCSHFIFRICCLWIKYFCLYQGTENAWSSKNKCLLCYRSIFGRVFVLCIV